MEEAPTPGTWTARERIFLRTAPAGLKKVDDIATSGSIRLTHAFVLEDRQNFPTQQYRPQDR